MGQTSNYVSLEDCSEMVVMKVVKKVFELVELGNEGT